jgi:hypothetical protein
VAGVTLKYVDGTAKTAVSNASGNYALKVSYNWSGKITPSKAGVNSFSPTSRTYTNVKVNTSGQNYRVNTVGAVKSTGAYDGQILESTETSGLGGSFNSTATNFIVGDDALNRQYRAILSFNTGILPDTAVIVTARLKIKSQSIVGTNPMSTHGMLVTEIKKPNFGASVLLGLDDFSAPADQIYAGNVGTTPVGDIYTGTIQATALQYINKTGLTQLRLRFLTDDNDDQGADYVAFFSGNTITAAYAPVLEIVYYMP